MPWHRIRQAGGPLFTVGGLGWSVTGWQSAPVGVTIMILGVLWTVTYVAWEPGMRALAAQVVDHQPPPDEEIAVSPSELRGAIASVMEELEHHRDLIQFALDDEVWWDRDRQMVAEAWRAHGSKFAQASQGGAHGKCRAAYRAVNELNWGHRRAWAEWTLTGPPPVTDTYDEVSVATQTLAMINEAFDELEAVAEDVQ